MTTLVNGPFGWVFGLMLVLIVLKTLLILALLLNRARRKRSQRVLDERREFEQLVSAVSAGLLDPPPERADEEVEKALERVLVVMQFDRCSVFEYSRDKGSCRITHSAQSAACPPLRREMAEVELPWLLRRLQSGATVVLNDVASDLPAEAIAERRYAEGYGSKSWLAVPVTVGQDVVRAVSYHRLRPRGWPADLVSRLQLLAEIFIAALTSMQARGALRENEERLRLALAAGRMGVWEWDLVRQMDTWSKEYFLIMGLAPFCVAPSPHAWASRVHPDDLPRARGDAGSHRGAKALPLRVPFRLARRRDSLGGGAR